MSKPNRNTQLTNLGIAHKIDGVVIDITDTAMQAQLRRQIEKKYALRREDDRIVAQTRLLIRNGTDPADILQFIEHEVTQGVMSA